MINRFFIVAVTLLLIQSCDEVYKEERFNVIVPVMTGNAEDTLDNKEQETVENVEGKDNKQKQDDILALAPKVKQEVVKNEEQSNVPKQAAETVEQKKEGEPTPVEAQEEEEVGFSSDFTQESEEEIEKNERSDEALSDKSNNELDKSEVKNTPEEKKTETDAEEAAEPKKSKPEVKVKKIDPREAARKRWLSLKNFASRRGFSKEDIDSLVPESLSIENYLQFGDLEKTQKKLNDIEDKLKVVSASRPYVRKKYKRISKKIAEGQLGIDEKNDFNLRLKQIEEAINQSELNRANRELNELDIDLGQVETLDQVFEN